MKASITALLIILSNVVGFSQTESATVPFVAYWSKGDSYNFKVTKIKQKWDNLEQTKNDTASYVVNFEVIDSTETSYKIRWSHKINLKEFNLPQMFLEKFSNYESTEVIYTTNELGEFIEIENWEEIAKMTTNMLSDVVNILAEEDKSLNVADMNKAMQPFLKIYETQEGVEQLVFKEIQYFHLPFGTEFFVNESIEYETIMPNLLGGKPIRGETKLYIDSVNFETSYSRLIQEMKLNSTDTKALIINLFKQMSLKDKEMKLAMKTAQFDINDYNVYEFFYTPGVPIKIETKRETIIDIEKEKAKSIEISKIEWIE
jgi:hypothetical protein